MTEKFAVLGLLCALNGCTLLDSQIQPDRSVPASWRTPPAVAVGAPSAALFWKTFDDPILDQLESEALRANPDVHLAAANVEAYRARLAATQADRLPQLSLNIQGARGKGPGYGPEPVNAFSLGAALSWEIDLWGRLDRTSEAARADLLAQENIRRGIYLALASGVAQSYFTLRQLDAQLEITRNTAALRQQSLALFQLRFDGGVVSELELSQVRSEYAQTLAAIPQLESSVAQTENALSILLGRLPGPIERGKPLDGLRPPVIPPGMPADLLTRRPDIRAAEAQLTAAEIRVDVARLAWLPRISLTGLSGFASSDLSNLTRTDARHWNNALNASQPLFDGGRISAGIAGAQATRDADIAQYRKTVLQALRETEDALTASAKLREQIASQNRQVEALERYVELARLRYENGYTSYLEVIDAERALFNASLNRASSQSALLLASVNLYRSLGGEWMETYPLDTPAHAQYP